MISSLFLRSFSMVGWNGEAPAPDRLSRAPRADLLTSRTGEVRQASKDGTTERERERDDQSYDLIDFNVCLNVFMVSYQVSLELRALAGHPLIGF